MRVEGMKLGMGRRDDGGRDQFPVGMRVLAVDDDPTCLKVLEHLLLRCQYHVTTTNQAITALKLLRENRDKFDLVISDVHMPDMDGFKLLELVGLEMDLPVIMLSVNGETKTVMKGITHGACDYLLKPVRLEELKNIWQHVIRRRFSSPAKQISFDAEDECDNPTSSRDAEGNGIGSTLNGSTDHAERFSKKRKELSCTEEDDINSDNDNAHENDDSSAQKKPRVVWSVELHRKFVTAVNQLGIDKAVPKRILELMNVEKLTRENVASHLQKYRLYLKRLSVVASQQASLVAAFGGRDTSPYMCMGGSFDSFEGFHNYHHALAASSHLSGLIPYLPSGVLSQLNTSTLGIKGNSSPRTVPSIGASKDPVDGHGKFQVINLSGTQSLCAPWDQHKWMTVHDANHGGSSSGCDISSALSSNNLAADNASAAPVPFLLQTREPKSSIAPPASGPKSFQSGVSTLTNAVRTPALVGREMKCEDTAAVPSTCLVPVVSAGDGDDHDNSKLVGFNAGDGCVRKMAAENVGNDPIQQLKNTTFHLNAGMTTITDQTTAAFVPYFCEMARPFSDAPAGRLDKDEESIMCPKVQMGANYTSAYSFDGLLNSEEAFVDGEMGCDLYSLGACI